jgi:hypothetical protein
MGYRLEGTAIRGREDVVALHLVIRGTTAAPRAGSARACEDSSV